MKRLLCFLLCLSLTCCNREQQNKSYRRNRLNLSFKYDPITTDPKKSSDPLTSSFITMLYEGLVHEEPDGSVSLALAESYEISSDGRTYTFHLRDAKWSNGKPITSYDFEHSWKTLLEPSFNSPNAHFLYPIKNAQKAKKGLVSTNNVSVKTPDEKTLVVKLSSPTPHFLQMLCYSTFFPTYKDLELVDKEEHPYGIFSGPFSLKTWQNNHYLTLKKNAEFWDAQNTRLETIHISIVDTELTSYRLYELGEIDWLGSFFAPIPLDMLKQVTKNSHAIRSPIAATTVCFFNNDCYPFDNLNIRKAFAYAIDRKDIVENFSESKPTTAYSLIPPSLTKEQNVKLMPDGSKELALHYLELGLKELKLTKETFPKLTFDYFNFEEIKNLAQVLQELWQKNLGIQVNLQGFDVKIFLDKLFKKNFQFCLMSIIAQYNDPYNFFERFIDKNGAKNFCGWSNRNFEELVEFANNSQTVNERFKYLLKAESIFMMEMPVLPIYHQSRWYARNELLEGVEYCQTGRVDFRHSYFRFNDE
ncbi:MAG: Oligopeptide-binding protein OppA [Chlamydiia bacterium]|nr:Oligopeptide-binding protein OppA [Chlamydiia bacterium]